MPLPPRSLVLVPLGLALLLMLPGAGALHPVAGTSVGASASSSLTWTNVTASVAPAPRNWVGMAYDSATGKVVLYGGYNANYGVLFEDTWVYHGGGWSELVSTYNHSSVALSPHPNATSGLQMAYDPTLHGVLAFGGQAAYGAAYYNDTWLFKGGHWHQLYPKDSPPARSQYAMAYDPHTQRMVLFGGWDGTTLLADTWVFNGTNWAKAPTTVAPPARQFAALAYAAGLRSMVLVGGENGSRGIPGTWAFNGTAWSNLTRANTPAVRIFPYVTDLGNGTPVLFGGQQPGIGNGNTIPSYNTTYEFFGGSWHLLTTNTPPIARNNGGFAYDAATHCVLLFGGRYTGGYLGDTWTLC